MIKYRVMPVREQRPIDAEPFHDYTFDDGTVWTEFYRLSDGYLLRFPDLADFEVSASGKSVAAYPSVDVDELTIEHLYVNQLVPLALSRQGRPAFHASAVTVPQGCVAFLGRTGMGKSTLAASFATEDAAFLTDDALLIDETDDCCLALPSHASLRLWEDSVEAIVGANMPQLSVTSYSDKTRLLAGDALAYAATPCPLVACYVLESDDAAGVEISPLSGTAWHMAWIENSFLLDIKDKDLLAQHFNWTHRISRRVPTFQLDYPREYGMLPNVRTAITAHVASLGS